MVALALLLLLVPFAISLALSNNAAIGELRRSALNPLLLIAGYIALVIGDFASFAITGKGYFASNIVVAAPGQLAYVAVQHFVMLIGMVLGIAAGFTVSNHIQPPKPPTTKVDFRTVGATTFVALLLTWLLMLWSFTGGGFSLVDIAEMRVETVGNMEIFTISLLLFPALCYALPKQQLSIALPLVVFAFIILFFSGSRSRLLYVLVPFLFYLQVVRNIRLPRFAFLAGILVLGFFAIVALNLRTIALSGNQRFDLDAVTQTSNIFNFNDLAFVETGLAMNRLSGKQTEEYFGQNIVGFVLASVPRSVVPIKPMPGSVQFTQAYDPVGWYRFNRGLTIGGVNEFQSDFGLVVGPMMMLLFAAVWAFAFARVCARRTIHGFAWTTGLYIVAFLFLRSDLQSVGQVVSLFLLYSGFVYAWQRIKGGIAIRSHAKPSLERQADRHRRKVPLQSNALRSS